MIDTELRVISGIAMLSNLSVREAMDLLESNGIRKQDFATWHAEFGMVEKIVLDGRKCDSSALLAAGMQSVMVAKILGEGDTDGLDGYIKELLRLSAGRQVKSKLENALNKLASGADPIDVASSVDLLDVRGKQKVKKLSEYTSEVTEHIKSVSSGKKTPVVRTGIKELDEHIGGWQPTLCLIGADPGVGKSALLATTVRHIAANVGPVALFSLEDAPSWLSWRYMSDESGIDQSTMRFDKLPNKELKLVQSTSATINTYDKNIFVVDGSESGLKIEDIISTSHELIRVHGVKAIFIDHVGEIKSGITERYDLEVSKHLQLLRGVANKYQVPVIALMHMRRRENYIPSMQDFANSAGAERKARLALGLTREPGSDILSVHVLKQTNGPSGQKIDLKFKGAAAMVYGAEGGLR